LRITAQHDLVSTKADQLMQVLLRRLVQSGQVNDTFVSSLEVADTYGVAVGTARRALRQLEDRGFLQAKRGTGYVVAAKPTDAEVGGVTPATATKTILFVTQPGDATDPIVQVAMLYLNGIYHGCDTHIINAQLVRNTASDIAHAFAISRPIGIVLYAAIEPLAAATPDIPIVRIGRREYESNEIELFADIEVGSQMAFRHLCGLGHEKMALVIEPRNTYRRQSDWQSATLGMRAAFSHYGVAWSNDLIMAEETVPAVEPNLLNRLMDRGFTAAFALLYDHVFAIYQQAYRDGIRIGRDFSIVGSGNHGAAGEFVPSLCRVAWDPATYGRMAVEAIWNASGEQPTFIRGPIELERGESAGPLL
jgi:DNA-binding LacI/PurR family transcriptional regulator